MKIKSTTNVKKPPKTDELYTTKKAVESLVPFLKRELFHTIWCPADNEDSNFVSILRNAGFQVIATHVSSGQDFLTTPPPPHYDAIITNPPFSLKDQFLARCFSLNKPFVLLLPDQIFDSMKRIELFQKHEIQLLIPNRRFTYFYSDGTLIKNNFIKSIWVCFGMQLPATLNYYEFQN